ncbi:hypothetical protein ANCCAN_07096 [Ancylostoma caninum]|uniref:Uncharacterized protein n=1 Tax=Ancylostoma caninum TaxID=29170 RepID=A0A368GVC8_ANCCA|nr:hypothetical protein ANCCAN_07096 [Ancylostoma caninum]
MIGLCLPSVAVAVHLYLIVRNVALPIASAASVASRRVIEHSATRSESNVDLRRTPQ